MVVITNIKEFGKLPQIRESNSVCLKIVEYNENSTLHGPKYITDRDRPIIERLFWFFIVACALGSGIFLVMQIVHQWLTNPIITTINDLHYPLEDVNFPAVTICPTQKAIKGIDNIHLF